MNISLLSLQKQPNTAPNLFQRGVAYGKYGGGAAGREPGRGGEGPVCDPGRRTVPGPRAAGVLHGLHRQRDVHGGLQEAVDRRGADGQARGRLRRHRVGQRRDHGVLHHGGRREAALEALAARHGSAPEQRRVPLYGGGRAVLSGRGQDDQRPLPRRGQRVFGDERAAGLGPRGRQRRPAADDAAEELWAAV